MIDFLTCDYLIQGNERQQRLYIDIQKLNIVSILNEFKPVIAGTFPIDLDIEGSDVDLLLEVNMIDQYYHILYLLKDLNIKESHLSNDFFIIRIQSEHFNYEVYGSKQPVIEQFAYLHMVIEYKILLNQSDKFREEVRRLKMHGIKTEEAFCIMLNLDFENPYLDLLEYGKRMNYI